jgi:glycolate oxidase
VVPPRASREAGSTSGICNPGSTRLSIQTRIAAIGIETVEDAGRVIALPASAHEVSQLVGLAREEGWVVAPHAAGEPPNDEGSMGADPYDRRDGRHNGSAPAAVLLSSERMNSVDELAAADLMAVVGAGVTIRGLEENLAGEDLYWPGSDVAEPEARIGDVVAFAPGNWTLAGNLIRRYLLGLEVVTADGVRVQAGARTVKSVTGYDLRGLYVGSRGTLGVVTSLTLRLESTANRERVRERYGQDFDGLGGAAASVPSAAGTAPTGAGDPSTEDGGFAVLGRLKRELDPDGVFPSIERVLTRSS